MRWKALLKLVTSIYLIFSLYSLFNLYQSYQSKRGDKKRTNADENDNRSKKQRNDSEKDSVQTVEIWGKAAIGLYLWQHIFDAPLNKVHGDFLKEGQMLIENVNIVFQTGPMITPKTVNTDAKNVVLVINGREPKKIEFSVSWLEEIRKFRHLKNVAVILLGNEQCENDWLMTYMVNKGGFIKFAFIVYDIPYVDNKIFFQWPLGVATYRNFPRVYSKDLIQTAKRKYTCNFIGTVYKNSSREKLMKQFQTNSFLKEKCFLHERKGWKPSETRETRELYQNVVKNSDLTLCPVGINTECYRIYEAISFGSVPIVEDIMTPGKCGSSQSADKTSTPLRILKAMDAPLIYLKDWKELSTIISNEKKLSKEYVLKRRKNLLKWHEKFKYELRNLFVNQIKQGFDFKH
eukprot:Seg1319.10 transcript_id=Seg1319.10/GoldUCD/mRNA.D3Y31 product="Ribitol-5-phosphate xylosyltransferase 1" protein_id=Seg1319.10/GoldUCD/D3Y31